MSGQVQSTKTKLETPETRKAPSFKQPARDIGACPPRLLLFSKGDAGARAFWSAPPHRFGFSGSGRDEQRSLESPPEAIQSAVAAALCRRTPKRRTCWRCSVGNTAVRERASFWSAACLRRGFDRQAGSEAPRRFPFIGSSFISNRGIRRGLGRNWPSANKIFGDLGIGVSLDFGAWCLELNSSASVPTDNTLRLAPDTFGLRA